MNRLECLFKTAKWEGFFEFSVSVGQACPGDPLHLYGTAAFVPGGHMKVEAIASLEIKL